MQRLKKHQGIIRDDQGQALTEYVIVIPFVLFLFFACFETMVLAQTSQLANYASYAASRSYATSVGYFKGKNGGDEAAAKKDALSRAKTTACLVMAPVSHAQIGEGRRLTLFGTSTPLLDSARGLVAGKGTKIKELYGIAEGFLIAYVYRVKKFDCNEQGGVVTTTFDYYCPMSIPGFIELWDYIFEYRQNTGYKGQSHHEFDQGLAIYDPASMNAAVNEAFDWIIRTAGLLNKLNSLGISTGGLNNMLASINSALNQVISAAYSTGVTGAEYAVKLQVKSVCGYEDWSGTVKDGDNTNRCKDNPDPKAKKCGDAIERQQQQIEPLAKTVDIECTEANVARQAYSGDYKPFDDEGKATGDVVEDSDGALGATQKADRDLRNCSGFGTPPDGTGKPSGSYSTIRDYIPPDEAFYPFGHPTGSYYVPTECSDELTAYNDAYDDAFAKNDTLKKEKEDCDDAEDDLNDAQGTPKECKSFF